MIRTHKQSINHTKTCMIRTRTDRTTTKQYPNIKLNVRFVQTVKNSTTFIFLKNQTFKFFFQKDI